MIITTKTTISFKLPEENEAIQNFLKHNDMSEWQETTSSAMVMYTHQNSHLVYMKGGEDENHD